jgi:hypothetical protein
MPLLLIVAPILAVATGLLLGRLLFFGFDAASFAALAALAIAGLCGLLAISPAARESVRRAVRHACRAWRQIRDARRARLKARWSRPDPMAWWHSLPDAAQVAILALTLAVPAGIAAVAAFSSHRP